MMIYINYIIITIMHKLTIGPGHYSLILTIESETRVDSYDIDTFDIDKQDDYIILIIEDAIFKYFTFKLTKYEFNISIHTNMHILEYGYGNEIIINNTIKLTEEEYNQFYSVLDKL